MKKFILFLLILSTFFSLVGCTPKVEEEVPAEIDEEALRDEQNLLLFEKYEELITQLESQDYSGAHETVSLLEESAFNEMVTAGEIREIEITDENVSKYFSVLEITEWTDDEFGNVSGFITHVCVILKEEYVNLVVEDRTSVDLSWGATCSVKNCAVDLQNKVVSIENVFEGATTKFGAPEYMTGCITFTEILDDAEYHSQPVVGEIGEIVIIGEYLLDGKKKSVCFDYEKPEITHGQGTLALLSFE